METSQPSRSLIDFTESTNVEPHLKRRAVICYFLQLLPWGIFTAILLLESIIREFVNINGSTIQTFQTICFVFTILLGVIAVTGFYVSIYNLSPGISFILVILFFMMFSGVSVGFLTLELADNHALHVLAFGAPFVFLTASHLVSVCCMQSPTSSITIWILTIASPGIIFLLDEVVEPNREHLQLLYEMLAGGIAFGLLGAAWCSAVKVTLPIAYCFEIR